MPSIEEGSSVRFIGEKEKGKLFGNSLEEDRSKNWGLSRNIPYKVTKVINHGGKELCALKGISGFFDVSCFKPYSREDV